MVNLIQQFKEMSFREWIIGISIPVVSCGVAFIIVEFLIFLGV